MGAFFAIELEEAGVQRLVRGEIKIVGGKRVHERVEDAVTDKNTPQNGLFGLNAVGGLDEADRSSPDWDRQGMPCGNSSVGDA